jgi:hypothetical protein
MRQFVNYQNLFNTFDLVGREGPFTELSVFHLQSATKYICLHVRAGCSSSYM